MTDQPLPDSEEILEFPEFVAAMNERLRQASVSSAEQAFGIGCNIGLLPVFVVIVLLLVFRVINIIVAFILIVMAFLVLTGFGMLVSNIARTNTVRRVYQNEVEPEIARYLAQNRMSRSEFDSLAAAELASTALLQSYLGQVKPQDLPGEDNP